MHKEIWNLLNYDKQKETGLDEPNFVAWCNMAGSHAIDNSAPNSAATEQHIYSINYRNLVKDIFFCELSLEQRRDPKYQLQRGKSISTHQHKVVNQLLQKHLGDPRIALYILEHGLPTLLDSNLQPPTQAVLQNMLEEFMRWYAYVLQWLVGKQKNSNTIIAQKLSDLDQMEWQAEQRRRKQEVEEQLRWSAYLDTNRLEERREKLRLQQIAVQRFYRECA